MADIIVLGENSFIGKALTTHSSDVTLRTIPSANFRVLINCRIHPDYVHRPYDEQNDMDLKAACIAWRAGAKFVMLSTRQVYGDVHRLGKISETTLLKPITNYAINKVITEQRLQELYSKTSENLLILRLTNVYGYEADKHRYSFMGKVQNSLLENKEVILDSSPFVKKDFIPVEIAVKTILAAANSKKSGIYNVGAGKPIEIGRLIGWIIQGFGCGKLTCTSLIERDEFDIDCTKLKLNNLQPIEEIDHRWICHSIGVRLKSDPRYLSSRGVIVKLKSDPRYPTSSQI